MTNGLWIPDEVLRCDNLTPKEILVLSEIIALHNLKGCFALNRHFSERFNIGPSRASKIITSLTDKGFMSCEYKRAGKHITERVLTPCQIVNTPPCQNGNPPLTKRPIPLANLGEDNIHVITKQPTTEENDFSKALKAYPGTKRGLKTEFENFKKKHKDWQTEQSKLPAAVDQQKKTLWLNSEKRYIPHFQKWINNRRWEIETPEPMTEPQRTFEPGQNPLDKFAEQDRARKAALLLEAVA